MTSPPTQIPLSSALGLGLRQAVSLSSATLALFAARAMGVMALATLSWILLGTWLVGRAPVGIAATAGLLVCWLFAELLAGVVLAGALAQGRARLLGAPVPHLSQAVLSEASRGLTYPLWAMSVQLLVTLWRWAALWSAGTLYFRAIERGSGGMLGSSALALALVLGLPLGLLALLWLRVGLVDSVHERRTVSASLFEAVGHLRAHLFTPLALIVITAVLSVMAGALVSGTLSPLSTPRRLDPELLRLAALAILAGGVLGALPAALFELGGWHGLMALRLSWAGLLSAPSQPQRAAPGFAGGPALAGAVAGAAGASRPVIQARPVEHPARIVDARPVSTGSGADASGAPAPVVDARPVVDAAPVQAAPVPVSEADAGTGREVEPAPEGDAHSVPSAAEPAEPSSRGPASGDDEGEGPEPVKPPIAPE